MERRIKTPNYTGVIPLDESTAEGVSKTENKMIGTRIVYVVKLYIEYEVDDVHGIYATLSDAVARVKDLDGLGDDATIFPWVIGEDTHCGATLGWYKIENDVVIHRTRKDALEDGLD
jgi:hypothetical protein